MYIYIYIFFCSVFFHFISYIYRYTIIKMPKITNDAAYVRKLLHRWDHGNKAVRARILEDFIVANQNKTGPELECEFAQSASLFLTRLTAWLRMSYLFHEVS